MRPGSFWRNGGLLYPLVDELEGTHETMHALAVVMRKGGSGKTTLSAHLAVRAAAEGAGPVGLIDTDPQGSLQDWWLQRGDPSLHFARSTPSGLHRRLDEFRELGVRLVVVDTPPTSSKSIAQVVERMDIVLIPVRPSPHDLRLLKPTAEIVEPLGKPIVFVINAATRGARITSQAISLLSRYGPLAPGIIHNRVAFASSMIDGRTVMEISEASTAAAEIAQLWDYVDSKLHGDQPPALVPGLPDDRSSQHI